MKKRRIFFRVFPFNILTYPVLLNAWEQKNIDKEFEITIIDNEKTLNKIKFKQTDVILYSFMTPFLPLIHSEINKIKNSGVLIAAGGPHVSGEQELAFATGFDILFIGAGEDSFLRFAHSLLDNKLNSRIYREGTEGKNSSLNDFFPISKYFKTIPPLEIMRGCAWNCKYCGTGRNNLHFRDLQSIKFYLEEMGKKNFKRLNFISPSALEYEARQGRKINPGKIMEFLTLTRSYKFQFVEYGIFPSEIRPDTVSDEAMKILKKNVSNRAITIGAQSAVPARLKELARGHDVADIIRAVEIANANDFSVNLDFIIGTPGETIAERAFTIDFIKKLSAKYRVKTQLHFFFPLPGSGYEFRFPSYLTPEEKENLLALKKSGICRAGWVNNEKQIFLYFDWLKQYFPAHYARYH